MMKYPGAAPAGFAPAVPAAPARSLLARALAALRRWHERANAAHRLRDLDDRLLRDVGLSRRDIERAAPRRPQD